uniref:Calmodulin-binding domain-containing protein n=1 Tax=Noccaea caerulescens TaxID=107243 RepID=A0A1J3HLP4_NOCCA
MEEDTVNSFGTPGMMNEEDGDKPRGGADSTGKAMASKSKEKVIPHYLRASTGSCHDICKYGKREIPVEKPWRSTTKKIFKKASDVVDLNKSLMKPASSRTKKVVEVKKKKVADDSSSEIIKREVVSGGMKKPEAFMIPSGDETPVKKKVSSLCSKPKPSPVSLSRSVDALKPKVLTKSYSALTTLKSNVNNERVAASSPVLKPKMGSRIGGKDKDAKIKKATVSSRVDSRTVPVTSRSSLSPRLSARLAGSSSLRKSQSLKAASSSVSRPNQKLRNVNRADESNKQLHGYPVEEKTLHVVEMETTSKVVSEHDQNQQSIVEPFPPLSPTESTQKDDECTVSEEAEDYEYPSGSNEAESEEEETGKSNGEKKPRGRKEGESPDEEAARKLKFRRGKVVDADTVGESARKLKFRKGKGLGDDEGQDAQVRRSFKKREDVKEEEEEGDDGEKVVLRHQDVQEKDAQGLLNNVIEETASKLVEARKSKVKALVGAFETVISLQES